MSDSLKLKRLKEIRLQNLEKDFLENKLKGYNHYVFINERGRAEVVSKNGQWVAEHIKTKILKFNFQVAETSKKKVKDFTPVELEIYRKKFLT
tara:strand:+ start:89 stop:367 length:279 start_codon:yes stop_codon:yes gene_type:complete